MSTSALPQSPMPEAPTSEPRGEIVTLRQPGPPVETDPRGFDPTYGIQVGSEPYDDPTQGRTVGSDPYEDPTRPRP